ncbi:carboxymuconolactone decarboxylase [Rhodococcus oxybenzonivorans]|uniref:Carboxymuconolactone decarboxylase n=1 Tax=Rhodococcus oxybenzonivorans TaxID=1990687 RepID=A0A2S2BNU0_9NOCA|nr:MULTISPECIES: carboxymuconolactone decarboxylase family protein [Rhodococcus]AWK70277.1 carboxymuconolactone decarboxylase [Rhodococcus oxybenzonivorans]QTJ66876.1 carboxymuconolactone decarboxylase family protein [Rhodococcus sp. ZPP]
MSRVGSYSDDDLAGWLSASPELGKALGGFTDAVYNRNRLPLRVREIARMAIAVANECAVCRGARDGGGPDAGIDEHFYDHVLEWESWPGYGERERTAAEFAYRFATDHTALREDEDFWQRCHAHFSDELLTDLALSCALWLGTGRVLRVLDIGQSCRLTL